MKVSDTLCSSTHKGNNLGLRFHDYLYETNFHDAKKKLIQFILAKIFNFEKRLVWIKFKIRYHCFSSRKSLDNRLLNFINY